MHEKLWYKLYNAHCNIFNASNTGCPEQARPTRQDENRAGQWRVQLPAGQSPVSLNLPMLINGFKRLKWVWPQRSGKVRTLSCQRDARLEITKCRLRVQGRDMASTERYRERESQPAGPYKENSILLLDKCLHWKMPAYKWFYKGKSTRKIIKNSTLI